jgi:head-tail adaptor
MLSTEDLAGMREQQEEAQPDTAVISRPVRTSDSAGGYTTALTTIATVTCRLAPSRPREVLGGNREVTFTDWTITFPNGTDVQAGDTVVVGAQTFSVISTAVGSWSTAVRAYCVNII